MKMKLYITILGLLCCVGCVKNIETEEQNQLPQSGKYIMPLTVRATKNALHQFKILQNVDGSWGDSSSAQLSTAFTLIALLRTGETTASYEFGKTVKSAHQWLLHSTPETDQEYIATAVALADYVTSHYRFTTQSPYADEDQAAIPSEETKKISKCLNTVSKHCDILWKDFLTISRIPIELQKQTADKNIRFILKKYSECKFPVSLSSIDDFMLFYLCVKSRHFKYCGKKRKEWQEINKQIKFNIKELQGKDGLFTCLPESNKISATGLYIMNLAVYYIWANRFSPYIPSIMKKSEDMGLTIE
jgi:hypothetical protein